jgi:SpoIID/LytB domain protein
MVEGLRSVQEHPFTPSQIMNHCTDHSKIPIGTGILIDSTCGKLAKWLRFIGIDTLSVVDDDQATAERIALKTGRIIVTRSEKYKNRKKIRSIILKEETLDRQIMEIDQLIDLRSKIKPFGRCSVCNSELIPVDKKKVKNRIPPFVHKTHNIFYLCPKCDKIYWKGTHYSRIREKLTHLLSLFFCILIFLFGCTKKSLYNTDARGTPLVRVLICESDGTISLHSQGEISVRDNARKFLIQKYDTVHVSVTDPDRFPILFESKRDFPIYVNGLGYLGQIQVQREPHLKVINVVDLETYLKGVVPHEIGTRSIEEIEAVKAQAVAARTYALKHLNLKENPFFDLVSTVYDQVYKGTEYTYLVSDSAVDATCGEIMTYKEEPIEAKYSSTCGGRTSDVTDNWGDETVPYLRSVKDGPKVSPSESDLFCSISPLFRWKRRYSKDEFYDLIRKNLTLDDTTTASHTEPVIKSFSLSRNKKSQRVRELVIQTEKEEFIFEGLDIRKVLRENDKILWSNYFYIEEKQDSIIINGKGAGHGCGMCQWGAIGMARKGFRYDEILKHYYRGIRITKKY